jgi:chemotaxis protein MotB
MQQDGVRGNQVTQVRGYADQLLRVKTNPYDPSNRRVSILVKNSGSGAPPRLDHAAMADAKAETAKPGSGTAKPAAETGLKIGKGVSTAPAAAKPSAGKPVEKSGMMSKLKALLPGRH